MGWEHGIVLAIGALLGWLLAERSRAPTGAPSPPAEIPGSGMPFFPLPFGEGGVPDSTAESGTPGVAPRVLELAQRLVPFFNSTNHPSDLLENGVFIEGVTLLRESELSDLALVQYFTGENAIIACFAMEALSRREGAAPEIEDPILRAIDSVAPPSRWFALRAYRARHPAPSFGKLLARGGSNWHGRVAHQFLDEFRQQVGKPEDPEVFYEALPGMDSEDLEYLRAALARFEADVAAPFIAALDRYTAGTIDRGMLAEIGRVWGSAELDRIERFVPHPALDVINESLSKAISGENRRSILLVGEAGIGKKTAIEVFLAGLCGDGWVVFEAAPSDLVAGQSFIGQLEERMRRLLQQLTGGARVIWYVPQFKDLQWAGRHISSPVAALDLLLPYLESGQLLIIGSVDPRAYEHLSQHYPRLRSSVTALRILDFGVDESRDLARRWAEQRVFEGKGAPGFLDSATLETALELAQQYVGDRVLPGSLLELLERALEGKDWSNAAAQGLCKDDLFGVLMRLTGLPRVILDEEEGLDLDALRTFFGERIIGQREAVDALVDRVAMVKAGLVDGTRPLGVFLFAGPTGSGKTEIAKTLAHYLFGSPDRLVRLDMSEFQTADSLDRILGGNDPNDRTRALVHEIRKEPFAVVLLDEFEKAHPHVWDLFLQVFDDGRLTDRRGEVADFRHAVIILTSNVGAVSFTASGLGFGGASSTDDDRVRTAIGETFRPEFLNRIDRIVIFAPLEKHEIRRVLQLELEKVIRRRGLRHRSWAIEWEDSATEFLLEKGFSRELGARPLQRAIDRYLLAPLARTIVAHQIPKGDQFLLIRSDGRSIEVEFIDPDQGEAVEVEVVASGGISPPVGNFDVRSLALDGRGRNEEAEFLRGAVGELEARITDEAWRVQKKECLARTSHSGFWDSPDRHRVLGVAELMDRIESGHETARSLLGRLVGGSDRIDRESFSPRLVRSLAERIYLIREALSGLDGSCPQDAFLSLESRPGPGDDPERCDRFARRLAAMYRSWGERRRMRVRTLEETPDGESGYRLLLSVSGYGALPILEPESGLHIHESLERSQPGDLGRARVRVVAQGDLPLQGSPEELARTARRQILVLADGNAAIVRRYREGASPLVRDSRRKWRTTRVDRVFEGDFDLIVDGS